jgi:PAS domain-containing protein
MADSSAPKHRGSPAGSSESSPSAEWYAEQWSVLCDELDVSAPSEVVPKVRALSAGGGEAPGPGQVKEAFEEMHEQLESLWERNAELLDHLESTPDASASSSSGDALQPGTEALLDQLDAASLKEARTRVDGLKEQLDTLYHEKETLAEAGLMSAAEALDEIDRLQKKCDRLQGEQPGSPPAPSTEAPDGLDRLNLDGPDAARSALALAHEADAALAEALRELGVSSAPADVDPDALDDTLRALRDRATALRDHAGSVQAGAEVAQTLGLDSAEQAQELEQIVRRMSNTLDELRSERAELMDELGVVAPDDVLDLVRSLEHQLVEFYESQSQSPGDRLAETIEKVLGISTVEEAEELEALVHRMNERLDAARAKHETLAAAGYDPETALATIQNMEEQLVSLYEERDEALSSDDPSLEEAAHDILGLTSPADVRQLDQSVRQLTEQFDALQAEHQALTEAGLTAEDALLMLDNMSKQLSSLYADREEQQQALTDQIQALCDTLGLAPPDAPPESALAALTEEARTLLTEARASLPDREAPADLAGILHSLAEEVPSSGDGALGPEASTPIQDVLGISSVEEARDLASVVETMTEQLDSLYADREQLHELGLSSVESAVEMIQSMSAQLDELYEEQEWLQDRSSPGPAQQQDTFEQLATLYSEQEKLERALGVSDADAVIKMVEALADQLETLYSDREADFRANEAPAAATDPPPAEAAPSASTTGPRRSHPEHVLLSMRDQLEALYQEKEALLSMGIDDAREAAGRIDELEARLSTLKHEHQQCRGRLEQLEDELGTTNVDKIVEMVDAVPDVFDDPPADAPEATRDITAIDDAPSLLPEASAPRLDALSSSALDDLSVGVLRLDDDGVIQYLNDAALALPGLHTAEAPSEWRGEMLFQAVPSTSNTLILNRFRSGVEKGKMDARFPYTFVSPQHPPTAFFVHLYRADASGANWLLFRPAE